MISMVQHIIEINFYSSIKFDSHSQQRNLSKLQKKEDRFNNVYKSVGEPGNFYDMEDLEDTKDFDEYALPDAPPP